MYNITLQLYLYCCRMGKWSESPYIQAFVVLYQNPAPSGSCNLKPGEPEGSPDILDDPLLSPLVGETELLLLQT